MNRESLFTGLVFCVALIPTSGVAQETHHWVGTWAEAPSDRRASVHEVGPANATYRNIVRTSAGGTALRVELTNEFGTSPLIIGATHIALNAGSGSIQQGTDHVVTFAGQASVTIPAGAVVLSDPVDVHVKPLSSFAISVYVPEQPIEDLTCHDLAESTNFLAMGNKTASADMTGASPYSSWCVIRAIDVDSPSNRAVAIVALGDSITDGSQSTPNTNRRWPDVLAERLQASPETADVSVLNAGISGSRLLRDAAGPNALARFENDVLGQSGVRFLIVLEGINDIGRSCQTPDTEGPVTAKELIFAYEQIVNKAHQRGIKVIGGTIMPYEGAGYYSSQGEQVRQTINKWIRSSNVFDGVIDFDEVTRDPAHPSRLLSAVDSGDRLHPGDEGYKTMGTAIDLSFFRRP